MRPPLTLRLAAGLSAVATSISLAGPVHALATDDVVGGTTSAPSGLLRRGCHTYAYSYAVQVPTQDWALEVSIVDRRGHGVASFAYIGPYDEVAETTPFRLCRAATVPGRFRIRSTLNWYDDPMTPIPAPMSVTRFRLARS
ncbi:hypothetical protein [Nocardioides sp.]|uniref:hypothetical protein n=1 Tax=Nocardioides sp. TaxID=35761 RepID=UPI00286E7CCC|nr:hypothetical protein [Nocardioides sp.]